MLKFLKTKYKFWFPGFVVSTLFLLTSIIFHSSFSYMGNTDNSIMDLVLSNYKLLLVSFIFQLVLAYLVIGIGLNIIVRLAVLSISRFFRCKMNFLHSGFFIAVVIFIFWILQFLKMLVMYPQVFSDSFAQKSPILERFQIYLTSSSFPAFFEAPQAILLFILLLFFSIEIFSRIWDKRTFLLNHIYSISTEIALTFKKYRLKFLAVTFTIVVLLCVNLLYSFQKNKNIRNKHLNLLILGADALRPDHISAYGYFRKTTPTIDILIRNGTSFKNVYTALPRTFPAWVSILCSQYPFEHGIRHMFPTTKTRNKRFYTLAHYLKEQGYETSVYGDLAADIFPRIDLGFDAIDTPNLNFKLLIQQVIIKSHPYLYSFFLNNLGTRIFPSIRQEIHFNDPKFIVEKVKNRLSDYTKGDKQPFFINAWFSLTHFPFSAPYPYYKKFSAPDYKGPYKYYKNRLLTKNASDESSEEDKKQVRALYDGGVLAFDDAVKEILSHLRENDLLEKTLIVILSDHGENIDEKNYGFGHGEHLRGKYSLNIPFILHGPGIYPKESSQIVSSIDMVPTVIEALGFPATDSFKGESLFREKQAAVGAYTETGIWFENVSNFFFQKKRILYPGIAGLSTIDFNYNDEIIVQDFQENLINMAKHRAIITKEGFKLIYMPLQDRIEFELYDLKQDPDEKVNLALKRPDLLNKLKNIFYTFLKEKDSNIIFHEGFILPVFKEPIF